MRRYWWGQLLGETNRLMVPDAEHSEATGIFLLVPAMIGYYNAINANLARPTFTWTMDHETGDITISSSAQASLVRQWTATTFDNVRRDFRLIKGDTPADPCEFIPVQVRARGAAAAAAGLACASSSLLARAAQVFGKACVNPVIWTSQDVGLTSYSEGVWTCVCAAVCVSRWRWWMTVESMPCAVCGA